MVIMYYGDRHKGFIVSLGVKLQSSVSFFFLFSIKFFLKFSSLFFFQSGSTFF
eukprot:TRINITY_DN1760_c0_g1_i2.p1 TRINITY_DN1760_c0_g1~~TRINITY_DN1760_c0_g1_i2.p1  ORF type:complete len:53 (+),score=8.55 TRINITY_DN1760_c0_g1_i2:27-185(+)